MKLKWYYRLEAWLKTAWLIAIYGLDGATNKVNTELKELEISLLKEKKV